MPSEQQVMAGAAALAASPLIDTPELPAASWQGLARAVLEAADRIRAPKAFACTDGAAMRANHRARALHALAEHRCSTHLTDGFCVPRDGKCARFPKGGCASDAEYLLQAIESRGCTVIWEHDPTLVISIDRKSEAPPPPPPTDHWLHAPLFGRGG